MPKKSTIMPKNEHVTDREVRGLSFDLSKTRTGIATWAGQNPTGVFDVSLKDSIDTGELVAKWRHALADVFPPVGIDWVAIEDVRPVNKNHSEIHFAMLGVLAEFCYRRDTPLIRPTATQVKKILTGRGKADKDEMLAKARELYPLLNVQNHDQADAIAVGLFAVSMIDWKEPQPAKNFDRTPF